MYLGKYWNRSIETSSRKFVQRNNRSVALYLLHRPRRIKDAKQTLAVQLQTSIYGWLNAVRILIPYLLMPLQRRLAGDIVAILECSDDLKFTMLSYLDARVQKSTYSHRGETPPTLTKFRYYHFTEHKEPRLQVLCYRLVATRIDEAGDTDGDEWIFDVPSQPAEKYSGMLYQAYKCVVCNSIAEMIPITKLSGGKEEEKVTDPMKKFPFHLFLSPRFAKKYRYEWEPFEPQYLIDRPLSAKSTSLL
ncbi:hypothetical protein HK098_001660, partial [Nowakowskiella sp. JEL0407]